MLHVYSDEFYLIYSLIHFKIYLDLYLYIFCNIYVSCTSLISSFFFHLLFFPLHNISIIRQIYMNGEPFQVLGHKYFITVTTTWLFNMHGFHVINLFSTQFQKSRAVANILTKSLVLMCKSVILNRNYRVKFIKRKFYRIYLKISCVP